MPSQTTSRRKSGDVSGVEYYPNQFWVDPNDKIIKVRGVENGVVTIDLMGVEKTMNSYDLTVYLDKFNYQEKELETNEDFNEVIKNSSFNSREIIANVKNSVKRRGS